MLYAITINENHSIYDLDMQQVINKLVQFSHTSYVDLVHHRNDHYHALIDTPYTKEDLQQLRMFHVEQIRNVKAYVKYMHDHDVTNSTTHGELTYYEIDSIVDTLINVGPVQTVRLYGWQALKNYKALKEFHNDYITGNNVND